VKRYSPQQQNARRNALQARTARARRYAAPWTVHDDLTLYLSVHTVAETARALGRTYYATNARRALLLDPSSRAAVRLAEYLRPQEAPERRETA
jgi:hypothetical protein